MADGKWVSGLSPEMPVGDAAAVVLASRFKVVCRYLPLAAEKADEDVEYVHQLRVSTRRAGAALRVLGDALPRKLFKRAKRSLRTIRRAAGGARDWDVFLEGLGGSKVLRTDTGKPALDFLLGFALGEREAAQHHLVTAVADAGPTLYGVCDALPGATADPVDDTARTYGELAALHTLALFTTFDRGVEANPNDPVELHQLRILGKQVRYASELFAPCFGPAFTDELYPAVEALQETLGCLQDAHVGAARLVDLREKVRRVMPDEWGRLKPGIERLAAAHRRKVPISLKQFQAWRKTWANLRARHPLEGLLRGN